MNKPVRPELVRTLPFAPAVPIRRVGQVALDPAAPLGQAEAGAALADIPDWFPWMKNSVTKRTQELWAAALVKVPDLLVDDVQRAIANIASAEKPAGEFWTLDIGAIRAGAIVCRDERKRVSAERSARATGRKALAAQATPDPEAELRNRISREIVGDVAEGRVKLGDENAFARELAARLARARRGDPTRTPGASAPKSVAAIARVAVKAVPPPVLEMSPANVRARQAELRAQAEQITHEATRDAIATDEDTTNKTTTEGAPR